MNPQRENIPLNVRLGKWAGLFAGAMAWGLEQQIVATTAYTRCPEGTKVLATTVGIVCGLIAVIGGVLSWHALRQLPGNTNAQSDMRVDADRFIAILSIMMAVMGVLAITFGTPAGWILRCER